MKSAENSRLRPGLLCGLLTAILGIVVLIGWQMELRVITALHDDYIPMAPSTALLFILCGLELIARNLNLYKENASRSKISPAPVILFVAVLLFILSIQNIHSNWEFLGLEISGSVADSPVGHMSPITALCFIAAGISLLASQNILKKRPRHTLLGIVAALALLLPCLVFFLAYLYGAPLFYDVSLIPPAVNTLAGFLLLATGLLDTHFHHAALHYDRPGLRAKDPAGFLWSFIGLTILIISIAYYYQRQHRIDFDTEISAQLTAIAELKSNEIQVIRQEWVDDGQAITQSPYLQQLAQQIVHHDDNLRPKEQLLKLLESWENHGSYNAAFFFDQHGHEQVSTLENTAHPSSIIIDRVAARKNNMHVNIQDFYRNEYDDKVYLALLVPVHASNGTTLGTLILRINPHLRLYPLINVWPLASQSAETLLVRKERGEVVFLNELRFHDNSALRLRYPINNKALPAVKAVEGFTGIVDGLDYRNIKVVAEIRAIPDTPWFMVTRMDRSEVYNTLNERMWTAIAFVLFIIISLGMALALLWRQQRLDYYKEQYNTALRLEIYGQAFAQNSEGIMVCDAKNHLTLINDAFTTITGYTASDVLGKNPRLLQSTRQDPQFYQTMWAELLENGSWQGEIWNRHKNGKEYPEWLTITALHDSTNDQQINHFIGVFSDISQHKKDEEEIRYLAHFDALTGLPNRTLLVDRIKQAIHFFQRNKGSFAVIFLDLDQFKNVNDSLGHHIGDLMLIDVANRLQSAVRQEDTICRLGSDLFVILLQETNADNAAAAAQKIKGIISEPFILQQSELSVSASIGIAMYPTDGNTPAALLQAADSAMHQAKNSGRDQFQFFTKTLLDSANRRVALDNALRGAISRDELTLYYQPQLDINSGKLIGCEALLRWNHAELGPISPAEFIPIAEDSGQILSIDSWVLHQAIRQMAIWQQRGILDFKVAVNLSASRFQHHDLLVMVRELLAEHNVSAKHLELELTEGLMMDNVGTTITVIDGLHQEGITLAIDDFGTGHSSLAYLKRFRIHKLKIDRSFVRDITVDPDDAAIVSTVIVLAKSLGLKTVAEGVETQEQETFLRELGCEEVQGYLHSRPLPADEFEAFLAKLSQ